METNGLRELIQTIVKDARKLSVAHTNEPDAPVNYACIFAQNDNEFNEIIAAARQLGSVVHDTAMGPVFHIAPIPTDAGQLTLLKIRRPDPKRQERGDADFTVADYETFKKTYLGKPGWGLISRPEMEMLELIDPSFNVLAYYSHPTLATVLKLQPEVDKK